VSKHLTSCAGLNQYTLRVSGADISEGLHDQEPPEGTSVRVVGADRGEVGRGQAFLVAANMGGRSVTCLRTFSQFDELDRLVRSAFCGNHLASSIPHLPPKHLKAIVDHSTFSFLEERREVLYHNSINPQVYYLRSTPSMFSSGFMLARYIKAVHLRLFLRMTLVYCCRHWMSTYSSWHISPGSSTTPIFRS
jgi:hypothetical protein